MHLPSQSSPSSRLFKALTAAVALPLIALAPALLASLLLTQDTVQPDEPGEHATTIDVADIDPEGTVMYTVSPPNGSGGDSDIEFVVLADMLEVIQNGDLIKVTVIDQGTDYGFSSSVDSELEEEGCLITLNLRARTIGPTTESAHTTDT